MWLETKFQPFQLRNDKDIGCRIDVHGAGMTCTPLTFGVRIYLRHNTCQSELKENYFSDHTIQMLLWKPAARGLYSVVRLFSHYHEMMTTNKFVDGSGHARTYANAHAVSRRSLSQKVLLDQVRNTRRVDVLNLPQPDARRSGVWSVWSKSPIRSSLPSPSEGRKPN